MALGNTYVKAAVGIDLHGDVHAASYWHGGGYTYDPGIFTHEFQQCLAEYVLEQGRLSVTVAYYAFACNLVKESRSMPNCRVLLGGFVALALDGLDMQQFGTVHVLYVAQYAYQILDVVSVNGTEISDIHALEHVVLMGQFYLDVVVAAYYLTALAVIHQSQFVKCP